TRVGLGAEVTVVAPGAVRARRIGTQAGRRVADAGVVALVARRADDGVGADAHAGLTRVDLGAEVAVGARGAVGLCGIGTHAGGRVADTGIVTLIARRADDGIHADTLTREARVHLRAGIAVVAGYAVGRETTDARPGVYAARFGSVAGLGVVAVG